MAIEIGKFVSISMAMHVGKEVGTDMCAVVGTMDGARVGRLAVTRVRI